MCGNALGSPFHVITQCPTVQNTRKTNNFHTLKHLCSQPVSASAELKEAATLQEFYYTDTDINTDVRRVGLLGKEARAG